MKASPLARTQEALLRDLETSQTQVRSLIERNADGILVVCPEGLIRFANPAACMLLERECDALLGEYFGIPILPGETTEIDIPLAQGGLRVAELRIVEIEWEGQPACLASLRDITEHQRLKAELRDKAQQLTEANRRKDEFLAMLSHELRNPLAPIVNSAAFLGELGLGNPAAERHIGVIQRQASHLSRLLDDLLDVLRVTHGKVSLSQDLLELRSQVIEPALELVAGAVTARKHKLEARLPQHPVYVRGDATRLQQALGNLLNNAAKYTPVNGRIELTVSCPPAEVVIEVRDNGKGIDGELLPKVFELFVQGDHSLDRSAGGLGVGLAMVKSLIGLHGGHVAAASDGAGKGSTFTLSLPAAPPEARDPRTREVVLPRCASAARTVVVVDDNRDAAETIADLLLSWGHRPHVAYDGETALRLVAELRPEVLLLDLGLPGLNGYAVAESLQAQGLREGLLLIAVTGYGQEADRARTAAAGFDHHLVKPVDPERLREVLGGGGQEG